MSTHPYSRDVLGSMHPHPINSNLFIYPWSNLFFFPQTRISLLLIIYFPRYWPILHHPGCHIIKSQRSLKLVNIFYKWPPQKSCLLPQQLRPLTPPPFRTENNDYDNVLPNPSCFLIWRKEGTPGRNNSSPRTNSGRCMQRFIDMTWMSIYVAVSVPYLHSSTICDGFFRSSAVIQS